MANVLPFAFPQIKKPLPGLVTVSLLTLFKNRPSPSPYAEGNNNPANYRDLYGGGYDPDSFHKIPFSIMYAILLTIRVHFVKRIL
jgi:hypothetical protein